MKKEQRKYRCGQRTVSYFINKIRRNAALKRVKKTLSGSQKRKIRKEKEYNINSKYAKLDNFLIPASSSSCASASSSNARELDEQILEVKINAQEKSTVSDTSTNKDTLSKEKESENENEETKLIRNDFAHYVGTAIDADIREQTLKLGPYQPEGNFLKDAKGRSFSSSYSFISKAGQKIERKWLCYSTRLHVTYCQVCWLFADRTNMYFKEAFCKGVNDWQGISKKIKEHENSIIHIQACRTYDIWKQNKTVDSLLKCNFKEVNKVSQILRRIIDVTMTLAMCNLPFRGHRETGDSTQRGNFLNIIDLLAKYDPLLNVHLSKKRIQKYLSPKIQNELIAIIGSRIEENNVKNIRKCSFFLYYSGHGTGYF
ncbi:DUF4371 domain-containing protein [Trichonephila clavipes]|nr:DUF4371 domain-containing protein [Trichonephila clavipes]